MIADESKINQQALDDNEDLKGTFAAGGMFQIIVGPGDVDQVYDHMVADHGVREVSKDEAKEEAEAGGNIFSRFVKMIADIFVPILPALIAGGLLMALHSVLTAKGLFGEQSVIQMFPVMTDYDALINLVSSAAFASLPVLVGFSAAKRFGGNTYLGAAMGAAMVSPSLLSAYSMTDAAAAAKFWAYTDQSSVWNLFGLEVTKVGYQAMVIPTLVVTWIMCLIEKSLHKVLKGTADFLLTPLITLLITGFLPRYRRPRHPRALQLPDLRHQLGVHDPRRLRRPHLRFLLQRHRGDRPAPVVPGHRDPAVALQRRRRRLHLPDRLHGERRAGRGRPGRLLQARDGKLKGLAGAGGVSAVFGITEPAIFGVNLRLRWPFYCAMVAAAIGSGGVALLNVRGQALGAAASSASCRSSPSRSPPTWPSRSSSSSCPSASPSPTP